MSKDCNKESVRNTLDFLNEKAKKFKFAKRKELVLVLGDAAQSKITLILFLIESEMKAIPAHPYRFKYVDRYDLINKLSESDIPELITDNKSGVDYYIFPGWNRTVDVKRELSVLHFVDQVYDFANGIKLLFVLHSTVFDYTEDSFENRSYLREFVTNYTIWIKDTSKFLKSVSLVVTDVPIDPDQYRDDEYEIEHTASILRMVQRDFEDENKDNAISPEEKALNVRKINFIQMFLEKGRTRYNRIAILRAAHTSGSLYEIAILKKEKKVISFNIRNNMRYMSKKIGVLTFPISKELKQQLPVLIEGVQEFLITDLLDINSGFVDFFVQKESQITDLEVLHDIFIEGIKYVSKINSTELNQFAKELLGAINELKVDLLPNLLKILLDHIKLQSYLKSMGKNDTQNQIQFVDGLNIIKIYLEESKTWYDFAIRLHDELSDYNVQRDVIEYRRDVARIMAQLSIEKYEKKNVNDTNLRQFLSRIGSNLYQQVENMTVNFYKMNAIKMILNQTININLYSSCSSNGVQVKGYNVKLSEVVDINCFEKANFVELYAVNRFFIDTDIDKTGKKAQLTMIAKTWDIVGNHRIILDGEPGEPHEPVPDDIGRPKNGENGKPGKPGKPGGSAGHLVAIGNNFFNDDNLEIHINGGVGGPGQDGEQGEVNLCFSNLQDLSK